MFLPMSCTSPLTVASTTLPCAPCVPSFSSSMYGCEVGDRALHHARRLHDLRQEHPAGAEEVADDAHAVHQRPLDHVERPRRLLRAPPRCPSSMKSTIPCTSACSSRFATGASRQREVELALRPLAADAVGDLDEPLGRVGAAVEEHVLDALEQLRLDVLVDGELAGVDDAHVEPGADRVVEERRVHRLADRVVAAEREAEVRDAARRAHAGAALLDQRQALDERARVVVVLLDARRDGEHVRVEDDVLRRGSRPRRRAGRTRDRRSRRGARPSVAWPSSSNAITIDAGAVVADAARLARGTPPRPP